MSEGLKRCPFCGSSRVKYGENKRLHSYDYYGKKQMNVIMSVRCNVCKARGAPYSRIVNDDNREEAYMDLYKCAAENWNRRLYNENNT